MFATLQYATRMIHVVVVPVLLGASVRAVDAELVAHCAGDLQGGACTEPDTDRPPPSLHHHTAHTAAQTAR